MKVLIATDRTQGERPDDHVHTMPGELVRLPLTTCDDEGCGCRRSFGGLASAQATTTAEVVDRPDLRPWEYWTLLTDELVGQAGTDCLEVDDILELAVDLARHARIAAALPPGTVVEHHDGTIAVREYSPLVT